MYIHSFDFDKQSAVNVVSKAPIASRNTRILSEFIGVDFSIYNGQNFAILKVSASMVGFTFGDFVFTKKTGSRIHATSKTLKKAKRS